MDTLVTKACGLDVHQKSVVATLLIGPPGSKPTKKTRSFGTCTAELAELHDWLLTQGCTQVGMESTGVYWKPVYQMLAGDFEVIVGNARNIKAVPGRKTDVKDSEWLADLVRHGLVAKSFVPPAQQQALRELLRYRRKLVESAAGERNRLMRQLESAGIKLRSVMTDVFGTSGRRMVRALIEGKASVEEIAQLATKQLRAKAEAVQKALSAPLTPWQRSLLAMQLARVEASEADIAKLDELIDEHLAPFRRECQALQEIPGVGPLTAATIVAEVGTDMRMFSTPERLASWAGVCPGNNQTGGKHRSGRTRPGNQALKTALVESAQAAARTKNTYFKAKYGRLRGRMKHKPAIMAIAHKILGVAFKVLSGEPYKDLGPNYLDQLDPKRTAKTLVRRLEQLGYEVELKMVA